MKKWIFIIVVKTFGLGACMPCYAQDTSSQISKGADPLYQENGKMLTQELADSGNKVNTPSQLGKLKSASDQVGLVITINESGGVQVYSNQGSKQIPSIRPATINEILEKIAGTYEGAPLSTDQALTTMSASTSPSYEDLIAGYSTCSGYWAKCHKQSAVASEQCIDTCSFWSCNHAAGEMDGPCP